MLQVSKCTPRNSYFFTLTEKLATKKRALTSIYSGAFALAKLDCEQSLFFSDSNARARERRSRETRETRAAAREEKSARQRSTMG